MAKSFSYLLILSATIVASGTLSANQPPLQGGEFTVLRATIDAGGGQASGGQFVVRGTFGQHDVGRSGGGQYDLRAGFWTTPGPLEDALFKDRFEVIVPRMGQFTP
ncbi:MAG: hypothetical protein AAGJ52_02915 [Pseudomonadota bacterium]